MTLPTPETVAAFANCSPTMAAHFLSAIKRAAEVEQQEPAIAEYQSMANRSPVPPLPSEALNIMARAAVSALRLMCINPTQRDFWRVRDDGSLYCAGEKQHASPVAGVRSTFNHEGTIQDATPPAP